ncbi:MAG: adenylate/guanylate cyclase domain-containing protein [Rhodospirillales bacterium]|nr:adenylate/guanylate cyclase domain-containing protein [Rhodospirillales bacterium]
MEQDEAGTFERLRQRRTEVVEPAILRHRGRIFKLMGDGLLAEFGSAVDAVECAAAIQQAMAEANRAAPADRRVDLRIGVHVGDVIVEDKDRHGEAVNIAARLQQLAEPSGICVSRRVMDLARQKVAFSFEPRGEERLKNIVEPVAVYTLHLNGAPSEQAPPLPDKPSIAVLPFENLSGDPQQDYFADGMVEEVIMALSRMRWLFVIARNSSFTYKGRAVDVKQVGRELGVRYVLEGSMRKAGNRVRIGGQLIDATTGVHLWADRFEGTLDDIFDLQDQVTASVVGAIAPRLEQAEIERAKRKPTESLDAYDYFLRGTAAFNQWTREGNDEALSNFYRAIDIDPNFASAYGMAAGCYPLRKTSGWVVDGTREAVEAERLARRAAELGADDALALCTAGFVLGFVAGDLDNGAGLIDRGLQINPNFARGWLFRGWMNVWLGLPEVALEDIQRAMRLSPHDRHFSQMQVVTSYAHFCAGRYVEALSWVEKALLVRPSHLTALRVLAASCALDGRHEQASKAMVRLRELDPALRLSNLKEVIPLRRPEDFNRLAEGLRKAGLPD